MADLSTIDASQPLNSELARLGASRIRDLALALLTSFGIEHHLTGEHKFLFGNTAARPTAGHAGRIYINTQTLKIEYDTGSIWTTATAPLTAVFATAGIGAVSNQTSSTVETTYALLPSLTTSGGKVMLFGGIGWNLSIGGVVDATVTIRIKRDGVTITTTIHTVSSPDVAKVPLPTPTFLDQPAAGSYVYSVTAQTSSGLIVSTTATGNGQFRAVELG